MHATAPHRLRRLGVAAALGAMTLTGLSAMHPSIAAAKDAEGTDPCAALDGLSWLICEIEEFFGISHGSDTGGEPGGAPGGGTPGSGGNPGGGSPGGGASGDDPEVNIGDFDYVIVELEDRPGKDVWIPLENGKPKLGGAYEAHDQAPKNGPKNRPTNSKPPKPAPPQQEVVKNDRFTISVVSLPETDEPTTPTRPTTDGSDRSTTTTPVRPG